MQADQVIQMDDATSTTLPGVGTMHYVNGGGHEHWHLLDFERYELRTADSSQTLVHDQKTGFCLAAAFTSTECGRDHPELTSVEEGIRPGQSDRYLAYLEGQYLPLDPVTVPDGDYLLVHRVNPTGALREANPDNDAATLRVTVTWASATGTPSVTIVNSCLGSVQCAPPTTPPTPPADPLSAPGAEQAAPAPGPAVPAPDPQPVPVVTTPPAAPVTARAAMSRGMAGRLVKRAIQKSVKQKPRSLRTTCVRRGRATFSCRASWRTTGSATWTGRVRVWYRLANAELSWFYDLSATRRPDGRSVQTRAARGSASRAVFAGPDGTLLCRRLDLPPSE